MGGEMKKPPIVDRERLDEILKKISEVFVKENMSPFEVKIALDVIYNNIEKMDDIFTKAQITKALIKNTESAAPGVS